MDKINKIINNNRKIVFLGYLDSEEYYKVLNSCDIFCMPRNNSLFANAGFPFKLGEFLATGKGVVATKVGDVSQYLTNMENAMLIEPESVDEIVKAIEYLVLNTDEIARLGDSAIGVARENFDSDKLSES